MSTKAIAWIVGAVVVVGGAWYFWSSSSSSSSYTPPTSDTGTSAQREASAPSVSEVTVTKNSDAALAEDAALIDAQLQAASTDSNAAGSFSDTPVAQTE